MTTSEAQWRDWLHDVLDRVPGRVLFLSSDIDQILDCNSSAAELFGCDRDTLVNLTTYDLSRDKDYEHVRRAGLAFEDKLVSYHEVDKTFVRPDGTTFRGCLTMNAMRHPEYGTIVLALIDPIGSRSNETGSAAVSQTAWRDAYHDSISSSKAGSDTHVTVAAIGIRSIERSMEKLGWTSGKALSAAVLRRVAGAVSKSDVVIQLYGGTTAVLLHGIVDPEVAASIIGRMVSMFDHPVFVAGVPEYVEVQAGAVCVDGNLTDGDSALTMAVAALNAARASGDPVSVFDPETARKRRGQRMLEERIFAGIEAGLVRGAVQPIVSLATDEVVGIEALARLDLAPVGPISPDSFIPLASQRGLTSRVTEQVLADGLDAIRRLGPDGSGLSLSVNISGEQLTSRFPAWLEDHYPSGAKPEQLQLEVTESVLIERTESVDVLHELAEAGYCIAIDDFGTGFSSLTYLIEWPAQVLKLDKSFVGPIDTGDQRSMSIVRSVLDLAGELGMTTVAEGVERPEQLDLLRSWGCDRVQGYLLSRPVWPDQLETIFTQIRTAAQSPNDGRSWRDAAATPAIENTMRT